MASQADGWLTDPNFPLTGAQKTMHLNIGRGEVANRILCVGDLARAERLSGFFDSPSSKYANLSKRGFAIYTGTFRSTPVSIIGTGMGTPMTDFVVRECRHMTSGRMLMVRYGTCGLLSPTIPPGTIVCNYASRMITRNYDYSPSDDGSGGEPFLVSRRVEADTGLLAAVEGRMRGVFGDTGVVRGVDCTADSFYDSQGRISSLFDDFNGTLIEKVTEIEPEATNLQMETFKLLHLASISKGSILAAGCAIGLMNRSKQTVLGEVSLKEKELLGGFAILSALVDFPLG